MKKIIMTICAAVAMFTIVSCESNPAIKAGKEFIDNPTRENLEAFEEGIDNLSKAEKIEFFEWSQENEEKLDEAAELVFKETGEEMVKAFEEAAESMGKSMEKAAESMGESMEKAAEEMGKAFE